MNLLKIATKLYTIGILALFVPTSKSSHTLRPSENSRHANLLRVLLFKTTVLKTAKRDGTPQEVRYHPHVFSFEGRKVDFRGKRPGNRPREMEDTFHHNVPYAVIWFWESR